MSKWLEKQREREQAEQLATGQALQIGTVFEDPPAKPEAPATPPKPGTTYEWMQGDSLPKVARKLGFKRSELLEHNDIEDAGTIQPGDLLHLPVAQDVKTDRKTLIDVLPEPIPMHVRKAAGCKKWSFGNMTNWEDAKSLGFFPHNTNLTITGIARVPLTEANGKETTAAYYLDDNALGDYRQSGRLQWTVGYMWRDLAEGHVDKAAPLPVAQKAIKAQQPKPAPPAPSSTDGFDQKFVEKRLKDTLKQGAHAFKDSYQSLPALIPCTADLPQGVGVVDEKSGKRFVWIHDFDAKRPDRRLAHNQEVTIGGTFEYDGVLYGRPAKAAENFNWYGIDMNLLQSDDELYNMAPDAAERAARGHLTLTERIIWVPLAKLTSRWQPKQKK